MEASTYTSAGRAGLLARRSPVMRLQGDDRLIAMIRAGNDRAFEVLFDRYHARLLAFCRGMLRSSEDAEDVLQEVFANAHSAILADNRKIVARPWLYRIARNRCLNHLRKPVAENQETMDVLPADGGATVAEQVADREEFRDLVADVRDLPETQRSALLLREMEALSYEEIAATMETTVPAVKSLLVRARMSLAEAGESRRLTCGDVRLELAEAAEGLAKTTGAARRHIKRCERCSTFRKQLRADGRGLTAISPLAPLAPFALIKALSGKLGFGSGSGGVAGSTGAAAGSSAAAASAGGAAATAAASSFGSAVAAKAMATAATAALLTAGAVGVKNKVASDPQPAPETIAQTDPVQPSHAAVQPGVHGSGSTDEADHVVAAAPKDAPAPERSPAAADQSTDASTSGTTPDEPVAPAEPTDPEVEPAPEEPVDPELPIINGEHPPLIPGDPETSDDGGDSGYSGGDSDTLPGTGGSGSIGDEPEPAEPTEPEQPAEPIVPVEPVAPAEPAQPSSGDAAPESD